MSRKLTTKELIDKAQQVHGNRYDYSKVNYYNSHTKVTIICPEHGEFEQTPNNHLNGCGCPKCGLNIIKNNRKPLQLKFINNANIIHNNKYDYSKVIYEGSKIKISIICPEHGEFKQSPNSHLKGNGCPKCSGNYIDQNYFIQKVQQVHGDRYNYSKINYINGKTKVIIICPEHGEFEQTPNTHLRGNGCPKCAGMGFNWLSYNDAKKIIQQYNIKTQQEYYKWWNKNKKWCQKKGLPKYPHIFYRKNK